MLASPTSGPAALVTRKRFLAGGAALAWAVAYKPRASWAVTNEKVFDETDRLTAVKLTQGVACASAFGVSADDAQPFAAALARACAEDAVARDAVKTSLLHVRAGAEGRFIELEAPDILEHIRRDLERPIAQSSSVALQQLYVAIETLDTFVHGTRPRGAATLLVR